jgi:hypothetical protein
MKMKSIPLTMKSLEVNVGANLAGAVGCFQALDFSFPFSRPAASPLCLSDAGRTA